MVSYISHIIWRFIKYKPKEYKLLDARHNVMKNLITGDCDYLIKFILFGSEKDKKLRRLHKPRSILWNKDKEGKRFVKDDDLNHFEKKDVRLSEIDREITNDLELAFYHC